MAHFKHVMVDLETMGTATDSAIIAIGAVEFNPEGGAFGFIEGDVDSTPDFGREFYVNVDLQSSIETGLRVDASTVQWWLQQSEEARLKLLEDPRVHINRALVDFSEWFRFRVEDGVRHPGPEFIWARGTDFDVAILKFAYRAIGLEHPWAYNKGRDSRTYFDALGFDITKMENIGVAHNALDDAKFEAKAVIAASRMHHKRLYDLNLYERKALGISEPADDILAVLAGPEGRVIPVPQVAVDHSNNLDSQPNYNQMRGGPEYVPVPAAPGIDDEIPF